MSESYRMISQSPPAAAPEGQDELQSWFCIYHSYQQLSTTFKEWRHIGVSGMVGFIDVAGHLGSIPPVKEPQPPL